MSKLFPLVLYYIFYYKGKTVILSFCLTAALTLPVTAHLLVSLLQTEMGQRAKTTPLVIGPEGPGRTGFLRDRSPAEWSFTRFTSTPKPWGRCHKANGF